MFTDSQARALLKKLVLDHLDNSSLEVKCLVGVIEDPARQVPIRGALETIRAHGNNKFTAEELEVIDDLLYMYG